MPHGVKFNTNSMRGTSAMLSPNESATRSMPSIPSASGSVTASPVSLLPSGDRTRTPDESAEMQRHGDD
ncbi:hypothetical protein BDK61_2041 [Haloarcula quadrata]|jgi:hypothetical protein|uniref:Uncharacterized protein n=1 Tax=Haloarcula quadrata TaxID=182779 RepID=A0A495R758_9EURY|nr:hypothetical protein BDK61_2041 [Haloarcula quadrata]